MTRRIEFTVADEIAEKYDEARGHEPLASWIKRALESALGEGAKTPTERAPVSGKPSAPTPAPKTTTQAMLRQQKLNAAKAGQR